MEIQEILIEDLEVDEANIRGSDWVSDEELINSIKDQGIIEPLVVRKAAEKEKVDYTIVCGSRRWRAATEAGLESVPCIIKELTDAQAIGLSITENKDRKDIPVYRYVEAVKKLADEYNGKLAQEEKVKIISSETKLSRRSIQRYLSVATLPLQIIELLKPENQRSPETIELLNKFGVDAQMRMELSITKAEKIAKELQDYPLEKLMETAIVVMGIKSEEKALELIGKIKTYPMLSAQQIYEEKILKIPFGARWYLSVGSNIVVGMDQACMKEGQDRKTLVLQIIENWLKKKGYI